jgi:hypothetical protein
MSTRRSSPLPEISAALFFQNEVVARVKPGHDG